MKPSVLVVLGAAVLVACARGSTGEAEADLTPSADPTTPVVDAADASPKTTPPASTPDDAGADAPSQPPADSGGPTPTTSITGTIDGTSLVPTEAFAVTQGGSSPTALAVGLRNRTTFCADFAAGIDRANATTLLVYVDTTTSTVVPGTYTVGTTGGFRTRARFFDYDSQCKNLVTPSREWATSGTVTISSMTGASVVGTFSLDFGTDHVSGTFASTMCNQTGAPVTACKP